MGSGGVLSGLLSVLSSLRDILDSDFTENDVGGVILSSVDIGLVDGEEGLRRGIDTRSNEKRKGIIATSAMAFTRARSLSPIRLWMIRAPSAWRTGTAGCPFLDGNFAE